MFIASVKITIIDCAYGDEGGAEDGNTQHPVTGDINPWSFVVLVSRYGGFQQREREREAKSPLYAEFHTTCHRAHFSYAPSQLTQLINIKLHIWLYFTLLKIIIIILHLCKERILSMLLLFSIPCVIIIIIYTSRGAMLYHYPIYNRRCKFLLHKNN